jgi:Glucanosyltransferase
MSNSFTSTNWQANNYQLSVNGQPFFVKGVCYSPVPWGGDSNWLPYGDFFTPPWSAIWERDLPQMRKLNMNTIRTYNIDTATGDHSDFFSACYNSGENPVYVLVGFGQLNDVGLYDPPNPTAFATTLQNFTQMVQDYGSNPAILGFIVGNEVNNSATIASDTFWQNINQLCEVVHQYAPGKLAILSCVDDSMQTIQAGETNTKLTSLDVWGINSYRGNSSPQTANFDVLWSSFQTATVNSKRPLMLTEWGAPVSSHNPPVSGNDGGQLQFDTATMTALVQYINGHYTDITYNAGTTTNNGGKSNPNAPNWAAVGVGCCYFEWSDEWWKLDTYYQNTQCPATVQQPGVSQNGAFPGGWGDEESFGLNQITPDASLCPPNQRTTPPGGGCPGSWNFSTNQPYPPDILTLRSSGQTLAQLMAD